VTNYKKDPKLLDKIDEDEEEDERDKKPKSKGARRG